MAIRRRGRHARPSKPILPAVGAAASATVAAGAMVSIAASGHTVPPVNAQLMASYTPQANTSTVAKVVRTVPSVPSMYTVQPGNTLWGIAAKACGSGGKDSNLYGANVNTIGPNPNEIIPGQKLALDCAHASMTVAVTVSAVQTSLWHGAHENHLQHVADTQGSDTTQWQPQVTSYQQPAYQAPSQPSYQSSSDVSTAGDGSFQSCVINAESGGNPNVMNSSGHYGLYQFSESTWEEYGGSASDFGNASVGEQNQVFDNAMAQGGESNWSPYDGC